ncbi:DUF4270 family protein [Hymenobacter chitinivorans]|uniref:Uncharacterized protein DUF4270 n=1 Tax=Hymenobacter chitinivorans DSM 11115 TaxID=1121954 RepID=A0A2M9AQ25_9BACT|nr:DUF4270 family protein [Hymenobacter chitinivorans]PJJ47804.1 uncharacterized protein DUF4270 [Hymenobacter chitinivorans DSM 11115]
MSKLRLYFAALWPLLPRALPALLLVLGACTDPDDLGEELPAPKSVALAAAYTDTLTVRASTVLTDSVPSATTSYLLLGRYHDPRLGTITGRSYLQAGLTAAFTPDPGLRYDSLVLVLTTDTYRYGDTTRTQQLEVHRLTQGFQVNKTYFANDALTYAPAVLGHRSFRARAGLGTVRVRLDNSLGQELWQAGQNNQLTTLGELQSRLPGLVLTPATADDAALVRFRAAACSLLLYYHDPAAPTEALSYPISLAGDFTHFFQLQADRTGTPLASLTGIRQALGSTATGEETFIQAGLGLKTKLEFPYLAQLRELGGTIVINSAQLQIETVSSAENQFWPPPATLYARLTDRANRNGAYFLASDGTLAPLTYQRGVSERTGLDQGRYSLGLTAYVQGVLRGTLLNQGILLGSETAASPERTVLGSARKTAHPLRLRMYYTRVTL